MNASPDLTRQELELIVRLESTGAKLATITGHIRRLLDLSAPTANDLRRHMRRAHQSVAQTIEYAEMLEIDQTKLRIQRVVQAWDEGVAQAVSVYNQANHVLKKKKLKVGPEPPMPGFPDPDETGEELTADESVISLRLFASGDRETEGSASSRSRQGRRRREVPAQTQPTQTGTGIDQLVEATSNAQQQQQGGSHPPASGMRGTDDANSVARSPPLLSNFVNRVERPLASASQRMELQPGTSNPTGARRFRSLEEPQLVRRNRAGPVESRTLGVLRFRTPNQEPRQTQPGNQQRNPTNFEPRQNRSTSSSSTEGNQRGNGRPRRRLQRSRPTVRYSTCDDQGSHSAGANSTAQPLAQEIDHLLSFDELISGGQAHIGLLEKSLCEAQPRSPRTAVYRARAEAAHVFAAKLRSWADQAALGEKIQLEDLAQELDVLTEQVMLVFADQAPKPTVRSNAQRPPLSVEKSAFYDDSFHANRSSLEAQQGSWDNRTTQPRTRGDLSTTNLSYLGGTADPFVTARSGGAEIFQSKSDPASVLVQLHVAQEASRFVKTFRGGAQEYLFWRSSIEPLRTSQFLDRVTKFHRIKATLEGQALRRIDHILPYENDAVETLLSVLQSEYGTTESVIEQQYARLNRLKTPRENDVNSLQDFLCELHSVLAVLENCGRSPRQSYEFFAAVQKHVPESYARRWFGRTRNPQQSALDSLLEFLAEQVRIMKAAEYFAPSPSANATSQAAGKPKEHGRTSMDQPKASPTTAAKAGEAAADTSNLKTEPTKGKRWSKIGKYKSKFSQKGTEDQSPKTEEPAVKCPQCEGGHQLEDCAEFKALPPNERFKRVCLVFKVHYRCLRKHPLHQCAFKGDQRKCPVEETCPYFHHPLLHGTTDMPRLKETGKPAIAVGTVWHSSHHLNLLPVRLKGPTGQEISTTAMLDEGCSRSLISEDLAVQLNLQLEYTAIDLFGINGVRTEEMAPVSFEIAGMDVDSEWYAISHAATKKRLKFPEAEARWADFAVNRPAFQNLNLKNLQYQNIGVIVGNDAQHLRVVEPPETVKSGDYLAVKTGIGWYISGPRFDDNARSQDQANLLFVCTTQLEISQDATQKTLAEFHQFNALESLGIRPVEDKLAPMERKCLQKMKAALRFTEDGRPILPMLWKQNVKPPPSEQQARNRLKSLQRNLARNPKLAKLYAQGIAQDLEKGYIRRLSDAEAEKLRQKPHYFLPHFPVFHPDKPDKCRRVWDAKAQNFGCSLNSMLERGPDLLASLLGILFRFRAGPIAINADVEEFYPQVCLPEEDFPMVAFLWAPDQSAEPEVFVNVRHVFGAKCSPATVSFAALESLKAEGLQLSDCGDLYMDDWFVSGESVEELLSTAGRIRQAFLKHGFKLTKWMANRPEVLKTFPKAELASAAKELSFDSDDPLPRVKILGVKWDSNSDTLRCSARLPKHPTKPKNTAEVLSNLASLFDPLGIVAPVTALGKHLFQECWEQTKDWRAPLPQENAGKWERFLASLSELDQLATPRWYGFGSQEDITIHVFADASSRGYGAVAYATQSGKPAAFLLAKGKIINPSKSASIPRLELQAFIVATRLGVTIRRELKDRLTITKMVFWSDSTTVLRWIKNETTRFKAFVANRLGEIAGTFVGELHGLEVSSRYVPTSLNPADLISRGLTVAELTAQFSFWSQGPQFIVEPEVDWPEMDLPPAQEDKESEEIQKAFNLVCVGFPFESEANTSDNLLQFLDRLATDPNSDRSELQREAIRRAQEGMPVQVPANKTVVPSMGIAKGLALFKDSAGIIRVVSRLEKADFISEGEKFPILLPAHHPLTRLLIREAHHAVGHQGQEATGVQFRTQFYSAKLGSAIRKELFYCQHCRARKPRRLRVPLAPLHPSRLKFGAAPFSECGMDHFGPTRLDGTTRKYWALIFICLTTRAVHLEDCASPSAAEALLALQRFANRRGVPQTIRCDQARAFKSAGAIIGKSSADLCKEFQVSVERLYQVKFEFNPPHTPHWGGSWERAIKEAKKIVQMLRASTESISRVTPQVFRNFLVHAEAILNSRPIASDELGRPISPTQLLCPTAQLNGGFPLCATPLKILRVVRQAVAHFWRRWRTYYLSAISLNRAAGGRLLPVHLQAGDPVLVSDPTRLFGEHWRPAKVLSTYQSSDGFIRSADLEVDGQRQHHNIRNIGIVDAAVLSRLSSPAAHQLETGGSVNSATSVPSSG